MSVLTKTNYLAKYGVLGTTFPDNTVGAISESDMRDFGQDTADSLLFSSASIDVSTVSTASGTITLNFDSRSERIFLGSASFATPKTIALSNATNALVLDFEFNITNAAAILTFPSSFTMSDVRWDSGAKTWEPSDLGVFKAHAYFNGTNWRLDISQSTYV